MNYLKTIYSLYFPEVRHQLDELWNTKPHYLFDNNFNGQQEGKEIELLKVWSKWVSSNVIFSEQDFKHQYVTAGSSEAIREFINNCSINNKRLILFENDYEGYKAFAESSKCKYVIVDRDQFASFSFIERDVVIFSNPSSIDGKYWINYDKFCNYILINHPSVEIALDLCYVGICVNDVLINCNYKNIRTIFFSLSKVFGVYFHRIGGVFSKDELLGLVGNKWFKNMFSLEFGILLMKTFKVNELSLKYKNYKQEVEKTIETEFNIKIKENDVLILSYSDDYLTEFCRGLKTRICITPALLKKIDKDFDENY
jgi:histidinol-phosphate/aromatic aminotransferase/cobyric acid decarboxylase-like protein